MGQLKNSSKKLLWKTLSPYGQICRQMTGSWAGLTSSESRDRNRVTLQSTILHLSMSLPCQRVGSTKDVRIALSSVAGSYFEGLHSLFEAGLSVHWFQACLFEWERYFLGLRWGLLFCRNLWWLNSLGVLAFPKGNDNIMWSFWEENDSAPLSPWHSLGMSH